MPDKWSAEDREKASRQLYLKKFGTLEDVTDAEFTRWAKDSNSDISTMIDLQCSLNFAQEQIEEAREIFESYKDVLWAHYDEDSRIDPWLVRNPKEKGE